jgi:hypothetical protein
VTKEGSTHNLLICGPIMHSDLYQLACGNMDLDVFEIIFASGVGMNVIVFTQYSIGMGIHLDLDKAGTPALNLLAVNLPFICSLFHITAFPASSIACIAECLAC